MVVGILLIFVLTEEKTKVPQHKMIRSKNWGVHGRKVTLTPLKNQHDIGNHGKFPMFNGKLHFQMVNFPASRVGFSGGLYKSKNKNKQQIQPELNKHPLKSGGEWISLFSPCEKKKISPQNVLVDPRPPPTTEISPKITKNRQQVEKATNGFPLRSSTDAHKGQHAHHYQGN